MRQLLSRVINYTTVVIGVATTLLEDCAEPCMLSEHGPFPTLKPQVIQADRRASSGGSTRGRVFRRNSEGVQPNARLNASVK